MNIILYLLQIIQQLYQQNCWLINFICRYIPLKQWAFDDSHSPKYQKFKVDELPKIVYYHHDWDWKDLNNYYTQRYGKPVKPIKRRSECDITEDCTYPSCHDPQPYLDKNNGFKPPVVDDILSKAENMPAKWQTMIYFGQKKAPEKISEALNLLNIHTINK